MMPFELFLATQNRQRLILQLQRLVAGIRKALYDNSETRRRSLLMRVIARPHQWPRLDMPKTHPERFGLHLGKFTRCIKTRHRQVVARRAQILADSENVAANPGEIAKNFEQLAGLLAEADHHSGFCNARWPQLLRVAQ